MKKQLIQTMTAVILVLGLFSSAQAENSNQSAIRALLQTYEQVLNASDVAGVLRLYTRDGVFMAPHNPSAVGIHAIKAAYGSVFKAIDLNVKFDIAEIKMIASNWAFARTNSAGTTTINATGEKVAEGNQELFVLQNTGDGQWKIARYSFSTTNPR